ncbi:MAG: hypothetical protein ACFFDB_00650 [Promethearchaeota archaeon]
MRCEHCNSKIHKNLCELLDPKKKLCDKCYFKTYVNKGKIIIELDIECKRASMEEIIDYLDSFCNYTQDIEGYKMTFKLMNV